MKRLLLSCSIFVLLSLPLASAQAGTEEGGALSLDEALRIAYVQNPRMAEARKEISASKGRWIQAEALPDPEFEIEIGGFKSGGKNSVDSIAVRQPLDPLGTRFLRGRIAHDEVVIARNQVDVVWAGIRKEIIEIYARNLSQGKALSIAQENLNVTRQFYTRVETNFQSGSALRSDALRASIEVSRAENDLLVASKNLKISAGRFNLLLGRDPEAAVELTDVLEYEALQYEYLDLVQRALEHRADVRMEDRRLSARKKGFWQSVLEVIFPEMAIGIERTTEDFENDTSLMLSASYPLWGFNLGKVKEAKAEKEIQQLRLETLKREVGFEVYEAFLEAELADKQVQIVKKALEESNELLRQITVRYGEGEVLFLTYLENIKTIKETRLSYFNALMNYQEKVAELERAIQATPVPEVEK